ncbi:hypothetical protein CASFOL_021300 [Castilleja foliolosa]|uniref:Filament-like plant protein n=1 Tax=Castilleja foliolosa TaxID=1961234 RepID=A0ABD3CY49_9LAMI
MDKKSWPWKKKSFERANAYASDINANQVDKGIQDNNNEKTKHVKISIESYKHLTGLGDQVKSYEEQMQTLEDEVNELNEKLSEAHSEITDKDNMVKQHSKVAEEAISGWEKAETEAATLKNQVESVTLLKLTAEDKASQLDGALKECMRQIRNLKDEHDKKMHELVLNKTKLFDKMKLKLESQISNLEQELMKSASDNAALSRSLQDRSNMLIKLREEKSQAEAEVEYLKCSIESFEKDVNSLKYELHVARKEVEIRVEEKNMSVRSLEVANKQHLEGVKKIAKLEGECQRLRGLVRKKLPGPGAMAQLKLEVENLGRDKSHLRRSLDSSLKCQRENELLMEQLLAMDEQTVILKDALENRNSELQASRSMCADMASKLQSLEAQVQASDDTVSCVGSARSGATVSIPENSYVQKKNNLDSPQKNENGNQTGLMDDFLEMEKLAHGSNGEILSLEILDKTGNTRLEIAISSIYDFVMVLGKEANAVPGTSDDDGFIEMLDVFSAKYSDAINSKLNLVDFILDVSRVLSKATSMNFSVMGFKCSEERISTSSDCIDKVALPVNNCSDFSDSASDTDIPSDGNVVPTSELTANSRICSLEEFEQLKTDKNNLEADLARSTEKLLETEQLLANVKSQLTLVHKSNSLAETQLKCMAESYKALETRAEELQTEVNLLQGKIENLDNELQEERQSHQEAFTRCNDLPEKLQSCAAADDEETSQEKELASAAETLVECQETIFLLDKQLKALRPQTNISGSPKTLEEICGVNYFDDPSEMDIADSHRAGLEITLDHLLNGPPSPSGSESDKTITPQVASSKLRKHRAIKSGSSSASSTFAPEKQNRGFSRFFSSKGKNVHSVA